MKKLALSIAIIFVVCFIVPAVHWPVLSAKATYMDDDEYVTQNAFVQNPGWASAKRFLTEVLRPSTVGGYYQPMSMISLMLDSAMGGSPDNFLPYHRTNLFLHTANTALVIILLYLLFGNMWAAAAAGLVFGIHPMTVEPIAWLSERKALLSAFFSLWSLLFYVLYTRLSGRKYYAACIFAYLLALMSKPTSVPLPFVMLLMDYWPLNRLIIRGRLSRGAIFEKLPLFALSILSGVITLISQIFASSISLPGQADHKLLNPLLIICHNVVFYPCKMLWPANLSAFYDYPKPFALSNPAILGAVAATVILIVIIIVSLRWTKAIMTGWLIFLVVVLPTMQIFKFSEVIAADNFVYLPSLGLLMLLTSFILWFYKRHPRGMILIFVAVVLTAGAEAFAVRRDISYWGDTITLYKYMADRSPESVPVLGNLAIAYGNSGRSEEAIELLERAVRIDPTDPKILLNLGTAYSRVQRYPEAIDAIKRAIEIMPYNPIAYINLARTYAAMGMFAEEIEPCKKAIDLAPGYYSAYSTLGSAYVKLGRFDEAVKTYEKAAEKFPGKAEIKYALGATYLRIGDTGSAMKQCEILEKLDPKMGKQLRSLITPNE